MNLLQKLKYPNRPYSCLQSVTEIPRKLHLAPNSMEMYPYVVTGCG